MTTILFGLRYEVGTDYNSYLTIFNEIGQGSERLQERIEPIYYYMNLFFYKAKFHEQFIIFFSYFLTFLFIFIVLKKYSINYNISVIVLVTFGILFGMTNAVRQALACSVCLLSLPYIINRKFLKFLIFPVVGAGFHYSAFFFIPFYWLTNIKYNRLILLLFIFLAIYTHFNLYQILYSTLAITIIPDFYLGYLFSSQMERETSGLGIRLIFEFLILLLLIPFYNKIINSKCEKIIINMFIFGIMLNFAFSEIALIKRLAMYCYWFSFLAMPILIYKFKYPSKQFIYICFLVYAGFLFLRILSSEQFVPYQTILFI